MNYTTVFVLIAASLRKLSIENGISFQSIPLGEKKKKKKRKTDLVKDCFISSHTNRFIKFIGKR